VLFDWTYLEDLCGCRGLKQRNDWHALNVGCRDAFEVRSDTAKFRVHKRIDEVQVAIEPREHSVLDAIMDRKRDLGARRPDLTEINHTHHFDISAGRFKSELVL
jgi:hypothetical protein